MMVSKQLVRIEQSIMSILIFNLNIRYKILTMLFHNGRYYLNFNRIDMKKELRSRIKNQSNGYKPDIQTKPSGKKQRRQGARPLRQPKACTSQKTHSQAQDLNEVPAIKDEVESCQTAPDTPSNNNLELYITDICDHMIHLDKSFSETQSRSLKSAGNIQISSEMRKILIKWLIKVGRKFHVRSQTMHMCVQLIDYMLVHRGTTFNKTNFQLLGVTCLFISCKYNEIYTIEAEKYVQFCDGIYTVEQLFELESLVLLELNFNLQIPTIYQFVNKIMLEFKISGEHQTLIKSLADLFIFDFNSFNNYRKYELSVSIMYFTCKLLKLETLKCSLACYKDQIEPQIFKECFMAVVSLFKKSNLQNTFVSI